MKSIFVIVVFVAILFPVQTLANELPPIKAGLWAVDTQNGGRSAGTMKQCINKEVFEEMLSAGQKMMGGMCSKMEVKKDGDVYRSSMRCKIGGSQMRADSEISGDFNSEYTTTTRSSFSPPFMGQGDSTTVNSARYLGECTAGMKPGDMITPDGKKMNVLTMMKQMPDMSKMMQNMDQMMKGMKQMPRQ